MPDLSPLPEPHETRSTRGVANAPQDRDDPPDRDARDDAPDVGLLIEAPLRIPPSAIDTRIGLNWRRILASAGVEPKIDDRADHEDFLEMAAKAVAWADIAERWELPVWGWAGKPLAMAAVFPLQGATRDVPETLLCDQGAFRHDFFIGSKPLIAGSKPLTSRIADLAPPAIPYEESDAFFALAGRKMILARNIYDPEEEGITRYAHLPTAEEVLSQLGPRVVAKIVGGRGKEAAVEFFDNPDGAAHGCAVNGRIPEDLGYQLYRFGRLATLFQDAVPMAFEYRFLVVDGEIISGAGVVPELTPEDARPDVLFDARVRRSANEPIVEAPTSFISRAHDFAEDAVAAISEEGVVPRTYTLDVFHNPETSEWGVVELNPITRAGFYAADPEPVLEAVLAAALGERSFTPEMERGEAPAL